MVRRTVKREEDFSPEKILLGALTPYEIQAVLSVAPMEQIAAALEHVAVPKDESKRVVIRAQLGRALSLISPKPGRPPKPPCNGTCTRRRPCQVCRDRKAEAAARRKTANF